MKDALVLFDVAMSNGNCVINFPSSMPEEDRNIYLQAYQTTIEYIESGIPDESLVTESPDIEPFIQKLQETLGQKVQVEETGARFSSDLKETELLELIASLQVFNHQMERAKSMAYWVLADACQEYDRRFIQWSPTKRRVFLDKIASMTGLSSQSLARATRVAWRIPQHVRIPGWTYRHYEPLIRYARGIPYHHATKLMKRLAEGRIKVLKLTNGATVEVQTPFTYREVESIIQDELEVQPRKRKSGMRYIYMVDGQTYQSNELSESLLNDDAAIVIDTLYGRRIRGSDEASVRIPVYDPRYSYSAAKALGMR